MDAYIVVAHPCCHRQEGSIVFSDGAEIQIAPYISFAQCSNCGAHFARELINPLLDLDGSHPDISAWPKRWLRKLPPIDETIDRRTPEKIAA